MKPDPRHESYFDDLVTVTRAHAARDLLQPEEALAIASQFLGSIIAALDPEKFKDADILQAVIQNINDGNAATIMNAIGTPQGPTLN